VDETDRRARGEKTKKKKKKTKTKNIAGAFACISTSSPSTTPQQDLRPASRRCGARRNRNRRRDEGGLSRAVAWKLTAEKAEASTSTRSRPPRPGVEFKGAPEGYVRSTKIITCGRSRASARPSSMANTSGLRNRRTSSSRIPFPRGIRDCLSALASQAHSAWTLSP